MSRPASPVLFGFDFQSNAAIILMIENMTEMITVRIEGEEDIEIGLNDGTYVLAQAKSVVRASKDFDNVRQKAEAAMISLSGAAQKLKAKRLIYITNSPDPFKDEASKPMFYGPARLKFDDLPDRTREIISQWLEKIDKPLVTDLLTVQVVPFETDDDEQRYKVVKDKISEFVGDLDLHEPIYGLHKKLHSVWQEMFDKNGSKANRDIKVSKKDVVWPIIVFLTSKGLYYGDVELYADLDEGELEEIESRYSELIEDTCERFDIVVKVITDYGEKRLSGRDSIERFVSEYWEDYIEDLGLNGVEEPLKNSLTKVILHSILKKKITINKIKKSVNL